jgi:hypothetical protein
MPFTLAPLLVHSDATPPQAREALRAATLGPPERRAAELASAGRILFRETELDCGEVRDILGLDADYGCTQRG